jgi:hypothetical protein
MFFLPPIAAIDAVHQPIALAALAGYGICLLGMLVRVLIELMRSY